MDVPRTTVNRLLRSLTGYQLQRPVEPGQDPVRLARRLDAVRGRNASLRAERKRLRARAARAERRVERLRNHNANLKQRLETWRERATQEKAEERRREQQLADFDEAAREIVRTVQPRTMTPPLRVFGLVEAVRYVVAAGIPGDVVECGVWRGGSMQAAALALLEQGATDRDLHLFDTYEGMTEPTAEDVRLRDGREARDLLEESDRQARVWAEASLEDVRQGMAETGYPADRVHYHVGPVEQTIPGAAPERIALLRLDTDWYESTRHELRHLYPRLVPGGVLVLDDYGDWAGARRATDEFLAGLDHRLLLMPLERGRIAVKPHAVG